uniref:Serpin family G member 1 n=1 Tax=Anas platyrhynchos platyrhynchos TaxID=8840 RepID=A0A493U443_ANAPP
MAEAAEPGANLLFSPLNVALGLSHLLLGEGLRGHRHPAWHPWVLLWVPAEPRCHLQVPGVRPRSAWLPSWATQRGCSACTEPCSSWPPCPGCWPPRRSSTTQVSRGPVGLATRMGANPAPPDAPLRCAALSLQPRFLNESQRFYEALPQELSGNESLDLQRINAWVRQATRGRLPRLLAQLPPEPRLVLLSAVHFQARWQTPFKAKETVPLPFLRPGLPPVPVPTMTSKKYPVASFTDSRLQVQVGRLELSEGLSLVVLVPRGAPEALGAVERALDPPTFLALLRRAAGTPTRATAIALPRVHLDLAMDVVALVHDMDYGLFLDAELCGLARGPAVAVDAAQHRAVLALDEAGVEAAGAMATSVARTALLLEALQPFLFVVWDHAGEVPLFMGRLSDPQP